MDSVSPSRRSEIMSQIKSKDTWPEMRVRRLLHGLGYRYVLHRRDLPGAPDIVFPSRRKIVFVHGCFWHQHKGCIDGRIPKTRVAYWKPKLQRNVERNRLNISRLRHAGWKVMQIWECSTTQDNILRKRLSRFLGEPGPSEPSGENRYPPPPLHPHPPPAILTKSQR
jgi:DNA mismatch endonuclease (patch repair protein)